MAFFRREKPKIETGKVKPEEVKPEIGREEELKRSTLIYEVMHNLDLSEKNLISEMDARMRDGDKKNWKKKRDEWRAFKKIKEKFKQGNCDKEVLGFFSKATPYEKAVMEVAAIVREKMNTTPDNHPNKKGLERVRNTFERELSSIQAKRKEWEGSLKTIKMTEKEITDACFTGGWHQKEFWNKAVETMSPTDTMSSTERGNFEGTIANRPYYYPEGKEEKLIENLLYEESVHREENRRFYEEIARRRENRKEKGEATKLELEEERNKLREIFGIEEGTGEGSEKEGIKEISKAREEVEEVFEKKPEEESEKEI